MLALSGVLLFGSGGEKIEFFYENSRGMQVKKLHGFEGVIPNLERRYRETESGAALVADPRLGGGETLIFHGGLDLADDADPGRPGPVDDNDLTGELPPGDAQGALDARENDRTGALNVVVE